MPPRRRSARVFYVARSDLVRKSKKKSTAFIYVNYAGSWATFIMAFLPRFLRVFWDLGSRHVFRFGSGTFSAFLVGDAIDRPASTQLTTCPEIVAAAGPLM